MKIFLPLYFIIFLFSFISFAQAPVAEWYFIAQYALPGKAMARPSAGSIVSNPANASAPLSFNTSPFLYHNQQPTERLTDLMNKSKLPNGPFSIELWINYHVNPPVGALVSCRSNSTNGKGNTSYAKFASQTNPTNSPDNPALSTSSDDGWFFGYYNHEVLFTLKEEQTASISLAIERKDAIKSHWHHLVGTFDGKTLSFFHNGNLKKQLPVKSFSLPVDAQLELSSYMANETGMKTENLVRALRIYDRPLSARQVKGKLEELQGQVEKGTLYPGIFHFTAGPYLHYATQNSINLTWETDRVAHFTIEYGKKLPLTQSLEINPVILNNEKPTIEKLIQEATISGLEPGTTYFYNVKAVTDKGERIESGILTFATAVKEDMSFSFALIGDTEARPHVNNKIAKLVWDERPNFVVNVGDLTDGGTKNHKFEWNYEYFAGMDQLHSRIPVYPVPGNGEDDLYWYRQYHKLPLNEDFYSFKYGNAEFFMLNSNEVPEFAPGGKQYEWLKETLRKSTARWKFVAHHFALYSADEDDYGNSWEGPSDLGDLGIRKIVPLYEEFGVDMVFFGHLHTYMRTSPIRSGKVVKKGVIYIQTGGAGGNLEDFAPAKAWFSAKTYRGHHYCTISIVENQLSFKMYDLEGRIRDFLEISKE